MTSWRAFDNTPGEPRRPTEPRPVFRLAVVLGVALSAAVIAPVHGSRASADDGSPTLAALLGRFSSLPGLSARFREKKQMDLLAVAVESEGAIHFDPPGRFLRRVSAPAPSAALIEGDELRFRSDGRVERIDLSSNPAVAGFVESFRHVLAGDREALERTFHLALDRESDGEGWKLTLKPKGKPLSKLLRKLVLRGEGVHVKTMVMVEQNGDETRTEFFDIRVRRFSDEQAARVFRLQG